jgi:hypothetical protein
LDCRKAVVRVRMAAPSELCTDALCRSGLTVAAAPLEPAPKDLVLLALSHNYGVLLA